MKYIYLYLKYTIQTETVALEPIHTWFANGLSKGDFFEKRFGTSITEKFGRFDKKIQRNLSTKDAKLTRLTVIAVSDYPDLRRIILRDKKENTFVLHSYKNKKICFLVDFFDKKYKDL